MASNGESKNHAIVTVLGKDRSGIVAAVTAVIAKNGVNILDISQTCLRGVFTMTMLVDLDTLQSSFQELQRSLNDLGEELGVQIVLQREEVFDYMYRL